MAAGGEVEPSVELADPLTAPVGPAEGDEGLPEQVGGQRGLRLLELLGGIGGDIFKSRAIGKANEATAGRQARSNLIAALRGGGGGKVAAEQPRLGLLGNLVSGAGKLGTGLREAGAAETAGDEATFANRLAQRKAAADEQTSLAALIRASRTGTGKLPTAAQNKVSFMQKGKEIFDAGASISDLEARIRADDDFQALVQQSPNIAAELIGHAKKGWGDREQGIFDRTIEEARATFAENRDKIATQKFSLDVQKLHAEGYKDSLSAVVAQAADPDPNIPSPEDFFGSIGVSMDAFGPEGLSLIHGARKGSFGKWFEARRVFMKGLRDEQKVAWEQQFKEDGRSTDQRNKLFARIINLPGVKSFSGQQGIGGSFQRLTATYERYKKGGVDRGAYQAAILNQFQRLIDPATVREGDVRLLVEAQSWFDQVETSLKRVGSGGFVSDSMLSGMMSAAVQLHKAQRLFVESEVSGALDVWTRINGSDIISKKDMAGIVKNILGGVETDEDRLERLDRERGGG